MEKHDAASEPGDQGTLQRHGRTLLVATCLVLAVSATMVVVAYGIACWIPDWPTRGQFGDMFGFVNALFSGLALAAVAWTLVLQREELKLQRQELAATREEVKKSAEAQQALADSTRRQLELTERVRIQSEQRSIARSTPRFKGRYGPKLEGENAWRYEVELMGERIWDAWTRTETKGADVHFSPSGQLEPGAFASLRFSGDFQDRLRFTLHYRDSEGRPRATEYIFSLSDGTIVPNGELVSEEEV